MAAYDRSPLAVDWPGGRRGAWTWRERPDWSGWTVPTAEAPAEEGRLSGELAARAGGVILDIEPYRGFWRSDSVGEAEAFLRAYRQVTEAPIRVSLDQRRLRDGFPHRPFMEAAADFLPQVYWTDFGRPWREVLEEARSLLKPFGKPIEYVLPGNAESSDIGAAVSWCAEQGAAASIWVWQTVRPENWPR